MTSASVKDVSSLMNFVGGRNLTKTGGMNQMDSFGDVMNRTRSGGFGSQSQTMVGKQTAKTSATNLNSRKETTATEKPAGKTIKMKDMTAKQKQSVEEAGRKVAEEVAEELDVTQEEVERAMEELGLCAHSLLDPSNLTQLVLKLSGEQDATALLTDENLFASLQDILGAMAEVKMSLAQEMGLTPEDMQALLEAMRAGEEMLTENGSLAVDAESADGMEQENSPQITVEIKAGGEEIKLTADEKGNVTGTAEVIPQDTEESVADKYADSRNKGNGDDRQGQSESMMHTGNQTIDGLMQDKVQAAEGAFEQTEAFFSEQTQDIMDQIMDYMKIQLRPGMDQLEMQLHPESLGTVHVQLSTKGGEVTAQFQVQNETVKAALESQIATLQESLKEQGVKVEAVQVTVESHGFESNLWQGQGREENASSQNGRKAPRRINLSDLSRMLEEEASEEDLLAAKMMEANGNTVDYTA